MHARLLRAGDRTAARPPDGVLCGLPPEARALAGPKRIYIYIYIYNNNTSATTTTTTTNDK